jgi:hypothetical protein
MASQQAPKPATLLSRPIKVINVGLDRFARELETQAVPVVQVEWGPPAGGNAKLAALLAKLGS